MNPKLKTLRLMGILNVTPDSFSDGGKFIDPGAAVARALQMVAEGADIIDMGAESTRPGSAAVSAQEQLRRLLPVLNVFRKKSRCEVSIDTQSAEVAEACLAEGADIINDISALHRDPAMLKLLAKKRCRVILMHMQGTPQTMQKAPRYKNVVREVLAFLRERISACRKAGIAAERIWIDPGIGFGKTMAHNLALLRDLEKFSVLKNPLVIGVSRKSFLGTLTNEPVAERRVVASVTAGLLAAQRGALVLRVHDVAEHRTALAVMEALAKNTSR